MRKLLLFFTLLFTTSLFSQPFGNEWIDYNQTYYKFKIAENGIYKLSFQTLLNSNIPVNTINPQNIQLFAKGEEVPIYISGESDGVFNTTDYLEFYARKNDGWLDTALYKGRQDQPNPFYSLINDSITYFLTWNNSTNNLRFQEENAIDFGNYFQTPFILKENLQVYNSNYYDGRILTSQATNPEYTEAEGWMDAPIALGEFKNKSISTPNRYLSGPFVDFEIQVVGASDWQAVNNGDHHLRITFGSQTVDEIFEGYELLKIKRSFSPTELTRGNNNIRFESVNDLNVGVDRTALAYMRIVYPHTMSFSNASYFEFLLDDANNQNGQYLEVLFFNGGNSPVLYDLTNNKKVRVVETLSNYKVIIPNGGGRKQCVIANENEVKNITTPLSPVEGTGNFTDYRDPTNDSVFLILTHNSLFSEASTYGAYRNSQGTPSFVVDIENLYDQYAFGIRKHPLAIRNFMNQALTDWSFSPSHLFLVGKSVTAKDHRKLINSGPDAYLANLLPSFGNPSADNLLIAGLNNTNLEVPIPMGRLSAKSPAEVNIYLDKVIEYESAPQAKWMKRAMHFAGGKSVLETNRHEIYLNGYAKNFEDDFYGGKTFLFQKSSSAPYQTTLSDSIRNMINEGVSLMTFFGHSGTTGGFDISIDSPDELQNKGRYPVLLGNSCFAGNYHQYGILSTSEDYVIERDAGVIGFIANGNLGVGVFLNEYSSTFYRNLTRNLYGKSLAECMRQTVKEVQSPNTSELLKNVCIEMSLQGDPALVMNAPELPDYIVEKDHITILPEEVTTDLESFRVLIRVDNIGSTSPDSIGIQLNRDFPSAGAKDTTIFRKIAPVFFENFVEFTFPINVLTDVGENKFTLLVDPLDEVNEIDENNNRVDFTILIRSGEVIPVYPYDFSIVGEQSPVLRASTAFAFEKEKNYIFELDSVIEFNSVGKTSTMVLSSGGVIEWQPPALQNMQDSAVYYWRVSKVPEAGGVFNWRSSSFQYLTNESGFAQDDFDQFNKNNYLFLKQNRTTEELEFTDLVRELSVNTIGFAQFEELNDIKYSIDADTREKGSCFLRSAFLIAVLDSVTLESWEIPFNGQNLQNYFGQENNNGEWCRPNRLRAEKIFNFQADDTMQLFAMRDFLNNSIPDGNYVIAYNWLDIDYSAINAIDSSILQAFGNLGATVMNGIPDLHPFIITAQKGNTNSVIEAVGSARREKLEVRRTLTVSANFGEMTSVELGRSTNFKRLAYDFNALESNSEDSINFELIGVDIANRNEVLFNSTAMKLDTSISALIDGKIYDRLKLKFTALDEKDRTAPQLKRWQVSYVELPDAALSPNIFLQVNNDSLQQGETFEFQVAVKNVSKTDMDSLLVSYNVLNSRNEIKPVAQQKTAPLMGDSVIILKVEIPTLSLIGENTLFIEVNPSQSQNEKSLFNNFGQYDFFVFPDRVNPLLDVTFDGRHILNREIVSASPTIAIDLKDNNEFLALDDTSSFSLFLRYPNGNEDLINFGANADYSIQFVPASLPRNTARIIYKPNFSEDGIYQLRVQAKDKSGNASGNKDYRIEFEVVTKSTVTHLLNYPNPFSTSTRFVFTLTGSKIPDQIQIQIMTITGKVVREIDENELGPIHIGNNITEFAWDGKDQFGDQLANGVYLYRVKMKIDGNNIERRSTNIDKSFIKEFGKNVFIAIR